jgi:hypothetical protein
MFVKGEECRCWLVTLWLESSDMSNLIDRVDSQGWMKSACVREMVLF